MDGIRIRPITKEDTADIVRWRNTPAVQNNLFSRETLTPQHHLQWLQTKVDTGLCHQFIIVARQDGREMPIGTIFIKNIDQSSHKGEFGIFIGEAAARGKGYGTLAIEKILQYAFDVLTLNRVYLSVFADNAGAVHLYEKIGFAKEGLLREEFFDGTGYRDVWLMGILKKEWDTRRAG
ncbi:MAG: UDP-4-amino-4,6-dideoxy-N-acetyl-beta-L-altrosamine N-acetyltransferase [Eubacteriales bacterium]|nr:UDP-4-amino-4,6-dideoxy-N-acetyl-beta-L-altrosamine N-acetyltransferase [Eubacteriales bacterium]